MLDALEKIAAKYELLNARLADGALNRGEEYVATVREVQRLEPLVAALGDYRGILSRLEQARQMAADQSLDGELRQEAQLELGREEGAREALEARLKEMLVPPDPDDTKGVILEIRAGTGGCP
jgi:peptide chain release factor 1